MSTINQSEIPCTCPEQRYVFDTIEAIPLTVVIRVLAQCRGKSLIYFLRHSWANVTL